MQIKKYVSDTNSLSKSVVIDVRSLDRFSKGHIPNSISIPVLSEAELVKLKRVGFAKKVGKEIVAKSQKKILELLKIKTALPIVIVCQDGGLASKYIWESIRIEKEAYIFKGGYKQYKRLAYQQFNKPYNAFVLFGKTGSGKTELLEILEKEKVQTLNLEKIACHAGSVFGNLENRPQPTQEQFENNLAYKLQNVNIEEPLLLEYETANIGKVSIPQALLELINSAEPIYLEPDIKYRIERLVKVYGNINDENLKKGINILKEKNGDGKTELLLSELKSKQYKAVAEHLLDYFDQTKSYSQLPFTDYLATITNGNLNIAATEIRKVLAKKKAATEGDATVKQFL